MFSAFIKEQKWIILCLEPLLWGWFFPEKTNLQRQGCMAFHKRDRVCSLLLRFNALKAIKASKRFDRGCKP